MRGRLNNRKPDAFRALFQAASETLPTPFRDLSAPRFQDPSENLPTPFRDLFALPPYTPGPGPARDTP